MVRAAAALGIATEIDLARLLPPAHCRGPDCPGRLPRRWQHHPRLRSKVGNRKPTCTATPASPRQAGGIALLSPFDPICWNRDRAERLFNFHYRIELYTPQEKRKFGYYVLPFLNGDKLAGRLCLKADRDNDTLLVNASHHEAGADALATAKVLAPELRLMADWLGLAEVKIARSGNSRRSSAQSSVEQAAVLFHKTLQ